MTSGTLGPRLVAELRAIMELRAQLTGQLAAVDRKEATLLALVAEAQGCVAGDAARFDYEIDTATWRVLEGEAAGD